MPASSSVQPLYDHERPRRRPAPDWGGDELFDAVPRRRFARVDGGGEGAAEPALEVPASPELDAPGPARRLRLVEEHELEALAPPARRTVTITGHPGRSASPGRSRGTRTVEQRIHARPASFAGWAFALGLLLIVIAIATSG